MSNVEIKDLGSISIDDLRDALVRNGVEWAKDTTPKVDGTTRIETRRSWEMDGREATDDEIDLFVEMPFILGSSISPMEPREVTQAEIDDIANELVSVNKTKDILEGRVAKIRSTCFDAFNFMAAQDKAAEPEFTPSVFVSEKHGVKLCREITGGKPFVDMDLAREVLGDLFDKVVNRIETVKVITGPDGSTVSEEANVEFEINEKALEVQVTLGNITIDDLAKMTKTTKKIAKFITRKL